MAVFEYKANIRYCDINENNELSDKGIINILSQAAGVHSEQVGYGLNEIEETNYTWMLLFWKIRFYKRPKWNTTLNVKTWARKFEKVSSWRDFEVYNENGEKIAIATTEWVLIDAKKQAITRITEDMMERYGLEPKQAFEEEITGKMEKSENGKKIYEYTAQRGDIDVNHHVNNSNYLDFAYNAIPEGESLACNDIEIQYKKQIKLGETCSVFYEIKDNAKIITIKSMDEKVLHATLKFF